MDRVDVEQLYVRFAPMVKARALRLLRHPQAAQDAVQEVFVRALRSGHAFRGDASPVTWLYRVTTNLCLNQLRDQTRRAELWSRHGTTPSSQDRSSPAMVVQINQIFESIRPELQEIVFYHVVDELGHEEIAELMGVSPRTIANRLTEFRDHVASLVASTPESS
jgi:RNA polymerase sigma-70 factor (ECF subfamily)